ncbi:hypothetical protein GCM10010365_15160 [Streptomyces poonensis]|uniref:Uncharacterized protein n=1 Tax=Streptomyces poonensis TaxID=68255 RepID=A0A918PCV1_9ACTN|nr:hypothetical protein GCM10010365_15160 [Streptomyces poonensis]
MTPRLTVLDLIGLSLPQPPHDSSGLEQAIRTDDRGISLSEIVYVRIMACSLSGALTGTPLCQAAWEEHVFRQSRTSWR